MQFSPKKELLEPKGCFYIIIIIIIFLCCQNELSSLENKNGEVNVIILQKIIYKGIWNVFQAKFTTVHVFVLFWFH